MTKEEMVPPLESWAEHLKSLGSDDLSSLAGAYCWLTERNKPEDQAAEFTRRRKAIIAEFERRGTPDGTNNCPPSTGSTEES